MSDATTRTLVEWAGGRGALRRMIDAFYDRGTTPDHRRAFVTTMSVAADDAGLPDDPELRSALLAYLEWGTRIALANSQPGAELVEQAPVPRRGWGVAPPWTG